jgi:hypothetical protein
MLRGVVIALLLANALFFGWARGWFAPALPAPHSGEREPERLAAQLHPERVLVLPAQAASAAVAAARAAAIACLEAGPLGEADIAAAEAAVAALHLPEGSAQREAAAPPPLWLLYAARGADAAATRARAAELGKLQLTVEPLEAPAELAGGLLLSRHATRAEAEAALAAVNATHAASAAQAGKPALSLRYLRVASLPAPPARLWLRVPKADAEQQDKLKALPPGPLAGGFKACTPHTG